MTDPGRPLPFSQLLVRIAKLGALAIIAALVLVPPVMRSRQRVEQRDSTRLSIRLNWQSEGPPQRQDLVVARHRALDAVPPVAAVVLQRPQVLSISPYALHADGERVPHPPFDNVPDPLRGPPSPRS